VKYRIAICGLGLMALGVATATSAQAQGYYYGPPRGFAAPPMYDAGIPAGEVLMLVRAQGLTPLTRPARRGPRYVLLASDRMGGQLRVVVSAFDGRIIRVAPAHDPRFAYQPARPQAMVPGQPQYGAPPPPARYGRVPGPEVKDPPVARAPRQSAPPVAGSPGDQQLASAPATIEPAPRRPARTPLPRPRPATASNEAAPAQTAPAQAAAEAGAQPPTPAARPQQPASPAPTAAQSKAPPAETPMVPVAPLE
jgi:hypothetical protein